METKQVKENIAKPESNWANWALLQAWFTRKSQGVPVPDSERPALAELIVNRFAQLVGGEFAESDPVKRGPRCFIIIATGGYWGKGKTLEEAAKNSKASRSEKAFVYLVLNAAESSVWVDGYGTAQSDAPGAMFVEIGKTTVGGILSANKDS